MFDNVRSLFNYQLASSLSAMRDFSRPRRDRAERWDYEMPNRIHLRMAALTCVAGLLSGCSFLSWYPRAVEHKEGLGSGPIADHLRAQMSGSSEEKITAGINAFLIRSIPDHGFSRQNAEELGLRCAPPPSTECTYSGELWYRTENVPQGSPAYGKTFLDTIQVRLSYRKPREFVIQVHEHVLSEE